MNEAGKPQAGQREIRKLSKLGTAGKISGVFLCVALLLFCAAGTLAAQTRKKQPPAKPLDLNAATGEELQQLPGVGPTTARAIVRFRNKSGAFRRVEDLLAVRGITQRRLAKLRPYVTVVPPAQPGTRRPS